MRVKKRQSSGSASEPATPVDIQPYQEGEMTNQLQGSAPGMVCTGDDPAELVDKLTAAIQAGNASAAATLVAEISKHRLKLDINIPKEDVEQCSIEKEFSVRVHVEDRVAAGCFMNLTVKASDTILDLKRKVMLKYNFPMQVQRWIIGKKIPEDKEKLSKCGIKGPGHTLYLYLVTARSMGLSREDYETQRQAMLEGRIPSPVYQPNLLSGTDRSSDQMSWPSPLSPSEAKSRAYSNSQSPVRASSPVSLPDGGHDGNEHQGLASRQGSRKSLSSGTSLIHEMLSLVGSQGTLVNSESMYSEPRVSIGNEGAVGLRSRTPPHSEKETEAEGWSCPACTYINPPTRPGCRMCSGPRPSNYQVPPNYKMTTEEVDFMENQQRLERMTREAQQQMVFENYRQLMAMEEHNLVPNTEEFQCSICFDDIPAGEGIMLRDCLHQFCRECLANAVMHCEDAVVRCPFQDDSYSCGSALQEREIRALVQPEIYMKFLQKGLDQAESRTANSYHCKTADCRGWCEYEDLVNFFKCPVCKKENCLTCKAIHEGQNCKQYQDNLRVRAANDSAAQQTAEMLERLVASGEAMECPQCKVIVQKKGGCDWIKCSICKTEICWVTKGPRWGPQGEGDFSGGCKCRIGGRKCHPNCINCH